MSPGVDGGAAAPLQRVIPAPDLARAAWAWAHGMTILELGGRFPPDADPDVAWERGVATFDVSSGVGVSWSPDTMRHYRAGDVDATWPPGDANAVIRGSLWGE